MIQIPVAHLKIALAGLSRIIVEKTYMPILQCVHLQSSPDGLCIHGTNLDHHLRYRAPEAASATLEEAVVPVAVLRSAVADAATGGLVRIIPGSKKAPGRVESTLEALDLKESFPYTEPEEFVPWPEITGQGIVFPAAALQAVETSRNYASKDETRHTLCGTLLSAKAIVATNGCVLFADESIALDLKHRVILPTSSPVEILGRGKDCRLIIGARPVAVFEQGPWTIVSKLLDGHYPEWSAVRPMDASYVPLCVLQDETVKNLLKVVPRLVKAMGGKEAFCLCLDGKQAALQAGEGRVLTLREPLLSPVQGRYATDWAGLSTAFKDGFRDLWLGRVAKDNAALFFNPKSSRWVTVSARTHAMAAAVS